MFRTTDQKNIGGSSKLKVPSSQNTTDHISLCKFTKKIYVVETSCPLDTNLVRKYKRKMTFMDHYLRVCKSSTQDTISDS